jgi:hypothetical protein
VGVVDVDVADDGMARGKDSGRVTDEGSAMGSRARVGCWRGLVVVGRWDRTPSIRVYFWHNCDTTECPRHTVGSGNVSLQVEVVGEVSQVGCGR